MVTTVTGDMIVEPNVISVEPEPIIIVTVTTKDENGQTQTTTYEIAADITVREFIETIYQNEYTLEELAELYTILLNGVAANADAVLNDGDELALNWIETPVEPEDKITVTVTVKVEENEKDKYEDH